MTCYAPIQAFRAGSVNPATGKRPMQFTLSGSHTGVRQMLPCGRCIGCRLEWARRWAMRLMHEAKMHKENSFVTLTYSNETLPYCGTLVKEHLQGFHKRLHNRLLDSRGYGVRYYGVGEYGDTSRRPHYHSLLFGYQFPDLKKYSQNGNGDVIYSSKLLNEIWGFGDCKIGEVSFKSANYVARYCLKKVDGKKREAGHYVVLDSEGRPFERLPEFAHMSRRPGIATTYFEKYGDEIKKHDNVIVDGRAVPSSRYYDLKIEAVDPSAAELIKKKRRAKSVWSERQVDRRRTKEKLAESTSKLKGTKL
ncbi:MAG: replication initiator protein [Microviridae sp.]|nr:MAG: replication initiator protein [Microviridae sp.]